MMAFGHGEMKRELRTASAVQCWDRYSENGALARRLRRVLVRLKARGARREWF